MNRIKAWHLTRYVLINGTALVLIFLFGWYMGHNYNQKLLAIRSTGNPHDAGKVIFEQFGNSADVLNDAMSLLVLTEIFLKNKDIESASFTLNRAIEIMGK